MLHADRSGGSSSSTVYFGVSTLDIVGGWGLEKELDDHIGEILSAEGTPGLGGVYR